MQKSETARVLGRVSFDAAPGSRTLLSSVTGWHTNRYTSTAHLFRCELVMDSSEPPRNIYELENPARSSRQ